MAPPEKLEPRHGALLIEFADRQSKVLLSKAESTIGRSKECDVVIPDSRISRMHACITSVNGEFFVKDTASRNGTFVNGGPCYPIPLRNNDVITLGVSGLRLKFILEDSSSGSSSLFLTGLASARDSSELDQLRLFLEAARTLTSGGIVDDVLKKMLGVTLRITGAERGFIYLADKHGQPRMACGVAATGSELLHDSDVSRSVVEEAMLSAAEFIASDATQLSELAGRESIMQYELRTLVAIPLRGRRVHPAQPGKPLVNGVLYLDSRSVSGSLHGISHDVLRALAGECAAMLESAKLVEAEQEQRQYQKEMAIAASIQRSLIAREEVKCDIGWARGKSMPCKEIGGDFFDIHVSQDSMTVLVVDVSGKGFAAAILASMLQGMFCSQVSNGTPLVEAVSAVNKFVCSRVGGKKYATLLAAQVRKDDVLEIVNCGHVPALVAKNGSVTQIDECDVPVGWLPGATYHSTELSFPPGSRLCILTDGITEAENSEHLEFGLERVKQHLLAPDPATEIISAVQAFCGNLEAQDDRTLVVVERSLA